MNVTITICTNQNLSQKLKIYEIQKKITNLVKIIRLLMRENKISVDIASRPQRKIKRINLWNMKVALVPIFVEVTIKK